MSNIPIYIATSNNAKIHFIREFSEISPECNDVEFELASSSALANAEEDGNTYMSNAEKKAKTVFDYNLRFSITDNDFAVIANDSGCEFLNSEELTKKYYSNWPGIYTARAAKNAGSSDPLHEFINSELAEAGKHENEHTVRTFNHISTWVMIIRKNHHTYTIRTSACDSMYYKRFQRPNDKLSWSYDNLYSHIVPMITVNEMTQKMHREGLYMSDYDMIESIPPMVCMTSTQLARYYKSNVLGLRSIFEAMNTILKV